MLTWTFYPALIATLISIICLSYLAFNSRSGELPSNLSELAATNPHDLNRFRVVLWICGTLFAITVYGLIVPRIELPVLIFIAWTVTCIGNLIVAVIPARGQTLKLHNTFAQTMALGMLAMAYVFWFSLSGVYMALEMAIAITMTVLALLSFTDKRRYIFYELGFLFLSHFSIIIAALALLPN